MKKSQSTPKKTMQLSAFSLTFLFISCVLLLPVLSHANSKHFPLYKEIKNNVAFWENVYGKYTRTEAVIHDKTNLALIYEKFSLLPPKFPKAKELNRARKKAIMEKYQDMLLSLAEDQKPKNKQEKQIFAYFEKDPEKLKLASENLRTQTGLKERFEQGVVISGRYMKEIQDVFVKHGLPKELSYLPHVESSFINVARSKASACGIWQFTYGTGKKYLRIDNLVDERYDPILAANAAALYLKKSYELFKSWPLALTSYNYGQNGMKRAVEALGDYPSIFTSYSTGYFKFASRNFYSEFVAAYNVARKLEASSLQKDRPLISVSTTTQGIVSLKDLSKHFKVSQEILADYNPALRSVIIREEKDIPKGYSLRLPKTKHINKKILVIPTAYYKEKQKKDSSYIVRRGDTASSIAARYKISLRSLKQANKLNARADIRIGQRLLLPR